MRALKILPALLWAGAALAQSYSDALEKMRAGAFGEAVAILQPLAKTGPGDVRVFNLLGAAYSSAGDRKRGNEYFRKALALRPGYLPSLRNLAVNELALGMLAEARGHFGEIERQSPADPSAQLGLAQIEFAEKHFDKALARYAKSGDLYLKDSSALLGYATSCVELKETDRALEAIALLPDFDAGLLLARLGRYSDAAARFEEARARAPEDERVQFNLALALLKSGDFVAAERATRGTRPTSESLSVRAQALDGMGKTADAYEALRHATVLHPEEEGPYVELMALCAEHENFDLSLKVADAGVHRLPESKRIRTQRGIVLAMMGRFPDAEAELKIAGDAVASVARALVLMRMERTDDAVAELRARRDRDGGDYLVNWFLAEAMTRRGDGGEEALQALRRSVDLNGGVAQSRALLGKLLLARGDVAGAVQQLERSLALKADNVTAMYQLAQAYRKQGKTGEASELFAKVAKAKSQGEDTLTRDGMMRIVRDGAR